MRYNKRNRFPALALKGILMVAVVSACDDGAGLDDVEPSDLVGVYEFSEVTTTTVGDTIDQLDLGVTLTLTLGDDGATAGLLFAPDQAEDGGDFEADLGGAWSFDDDEGTVTFEHEADTFLRDMVFHAVRSGGTVQLRGEATFSGTTIRAVLARQ